MITYIYIAILIYFSMILVKLVLKKPDNWNWLMAAMVLTPWALRIFLIK
ncbi:hypothetical protein [Thermotoga profunda]|nr:hypothetical protein [Thermotoga profunda]